MITLPYWILLLLLIGFAYGIYAILKSFFSGKSKNWPRSIPKTRVPHDKDEETRRDFVANVSHELRTPVSIIKGFADSLLEDYEILKEKQRKSFLFKIQKNAERLNLLVEDLLSLAKLEKPQTTLIKEPLDLCSLIQNIEEEYTPKLFSEDSEHQISEETDSFERENNSQLFDQDSNEDEDFEIPAFLRRQKF